MSLSTYLSEAAKLLALTADADLDEAADAAIACLTAALGDDKPVLICGNGGSAADAMHIAGELVGRYKRERKAFRAIALGADAAITTAIANDYAFEEIFARQVEAHGAAGGVVWGLSTSGNSENVIRALAKAGDMGMTRIAMTGAGGGRMADVADILLAVPSSDTPRIQEAHTCLYHFLCERVEANLAD